MRNEDIFNEAKGLMIANSFDSAAQSYARSISQAKGGWQKNILLTVYDHGKDFLKRMAESKKEDEAIKYQQLAANFFYIAANTNIGEEKKESDKEKKESDAPANDRKGLPQAAAFYRCLLMQKIYASKDVAFKNKANDHASQCVSEAKEYFKTVRSEKPDINDLYTLATLLSPLECDKKNDASEKLGFIILEDYIEYINDEPMKQRAIGHLEQIGFRYLTGSPSRKKNEDEAANYFYTASMKGKGGANSIYCYARLLATGKKSSFHEIENSEYENEARKYYEIIRDDKSKKNKLHPGYLAIMYYHGVGGPERPGKAILNFEKASEQFKHAPSEYMLAKIYFESYEKVKIPKNSHLALKYCEKAIEHGYINEARSLLEKILKELYPKTWESKLRDCCPPLEESKPIDQPIAEPALNPHWFEDVNILAALATAPNSNDQLKELNKEELPFSESFLLQEFHQAAFKESSDSNKPQEYKYAPAYQLADNAEKTMKAIRRLQQDCFEYRDPLNTKRNYFDKIKLLSGKLASDDLNAQVQPASKLIYSLLGYATDCADLEQVRFLLEELKLDVNGHTSAGSSLMLACQIKNVDQGKAIINYLLEMKAETDYIKEDTYNTALHLCKSSEYANILLAHGATPSLDIKNKELLTPLAKVLTSYNSDEKSEEKEEKDKLIETFLNYSTPAQISEAITTLLEGTILRPKMSKEIIIQIIQKVEEILYRLDKPFPTTPLFSSIYGKDIQSNVQSIEVLLPFYPFELYRLYGVVLAAASASTDKVLQVIAPEKKSLFGAFFLAKRLNQLCQQNDDIKFNRIYLDAEKRLRKKNNDWFREQDTLPHELARFTLNLLSQLNDIKIKIEQIFSDLKSERKQLVLFNESLEKIKNGLEAAGEKKNELTQEIENRLKALSSNDLDNKIASLQKLSAEQKELDGKIEDMKKSQVELTKQRDTCENKLTTLEQELNSLFQQGINLENLEVMEEEQTRVGGRLIKLINEMTSRNDRFTSLLETYDWNKQTLENARIMLSRFEAISAEERRSLSSFRFSQNIEANQDNRAKRARLQKLKTGSENLDCIIEQTSKKESADLLELYKQMDQIHSVIDKIMEEFDCGHLKRDWKSLLANMELREEDKHSEENSVSHLSISQGSDTLPLAKSPFSIFNSRKPTREIEPSANNDEKIQLAMTTISQSQLANKAPAHEVKEEKREEVKIHFQSAQRDHSIESPQLPPLPLVNSTEMQEDLNDSSDEKRADNTPRM